MRQQQSSMMSSNACDERVGSAQRSRAWSMCFQHTIKVYPSFSSKVLVSVVGGGATQQGRPPPRPTRHLASFPMRPTQERKRRASARKRRPNLLGTRRNEAENGPENLVPHSSHARALRHDGPNHHGSVRPRACRCCGCLDHRWRPSESDSDCRRWAAGRFLEVCRRLRRQHRHLQGRPLRGAARRQPSMGLPGAAGPVERSS